MSGGVSSFQGVALQDLSLLLPLVSGDNSLVLVLFLVVLLHSHGHKYTLGIILVQVGHLFPGGILTDSQITNFPFNGDR